jgi:hypothetical protein
MKKNRIIYAAILASAVALSSCDLDKYPYSEVAADEFVTDDASLNSLVVGCYNGLHDVMYYEWALTELRSDNSRMYANGSTSSSSKLVEQLDQNVINSEHDWVSKYWNGAYAVIARCNNVLQYSSVASTDELRKQYEGEAMFLRSLEYFNLVRLYGPVFIVTSKTASDVARDMQRSTVDEVYAQIEGDLEQIVTEEMLPERQSDSSLGRADLIAAKALLAKVYATHYSVGDAQYVRGAQLCKEVLESGNVGNPTSGSALVPYADIFSTLNEMNREIIFAVRYQSGNVGLGSPFGNLFAPLNNGANVIMGTCSNFNMPSDNLFDAYEEGDLRRDVNISQGYTNETTGAWVSTRYCPKYLNKDQASNPITAQYDGDADWIVLRVGDIALLYAEMTNELYGPTAEACQYLNMIRERAGLADYTAAEIGSRYDFRQAVRNERRLELALENQRWFDLLRWDNAVETVNAYLKSEAFYSAYSYSVNDIAQWQTLLPIPVDVLNINPDVAQNYGY